MPSSRRSSWQLGALGALCLVTSALASDLTAAQGTALDMPQLRPGVLPEAPVLTSGAVIPEPYNPFFDIDWSSSLRGTYTNATSGDRFDVRLAPTVTLDHQGRRSAISLTGSAEIAKPQDGRIDISGLRLGLSSRYTLDRATEATLNASFTANQDFAGTPGVSNSIASAPETRVGSVDIGVTHRFGRFNVGVTAAAQRATYGETRLNDGTVVDNSDQDIWALDTGLRLGFQATPILEVFGQASLGRDQFDRASSILQLKTDATDATLEAGVTGRWWGRTLEATASTGLSLRRFDEDSLGEFSTQLYDASISYTPNETLRLRASLQTIVAPPGPDNPGTTRVEYAAAAGVDYTVNSLLTWRASVDWNSVRFIGSGDRERGYGLGVGADYNLGPHTVLTADYGFDHSNSTFDGIDDTHSFTAGVTVSR